MSIPLYPLKFQTIYKEKIWGGTKIRDILQKDFSPLPNCGETWELSGVKDNISVVANGPLKGKKLDELIKEYNTELLGEKVYSTYGNEFPLLVKFIDANDDLSIQVHPDDEQAREYSSMGKTEMWYIIQADKDATLITGFNQSLEKEKFLQHMENNTLEEVLNREDVSADDVYFIPAGRIHTIGKGILLAEIQQSSDITFRIYDFNRKDAQGNLRDLQVNEAINVIDYNTYHEYKSNKPLKRNAVQEIVKCSFFITNRLLLDGPFSRALDELHSFVIYTCLEGEAKIAEGSNEIYIRSGEVALIAASAQKVFFNPVGTCKLLETYIG